MPTESGRNTPDQEDIDLAEAFANLEVRDPQDQQEHNMPPPQNNIVPPAQANDDYRAGRIKARTGYLGHHTRALNRVEDWAGKIAYKLSRVTDDNLLKTADCEADIGEFEDYVKKIEETWDKVTDANQEVLDEYNESQVLAEELRPEAEAKDPQILWIKSKEDIQIRVMHHAREMLGKLKAEMARGDAAYAVAHPSASDRDRAAQRKLELRARFKISDLVEVFNGHDVLDYLP